MMSVLYTVEEKEKSYDNDCMTFTRNIAPGCVIKRKREEW
jgi:hypothetical protein